jgi:hypothetical protein
VEVYSLQDSRLDVAQDSADASSFLSAETGVWVVLHRATHFFML